MPDFWDLVEEMEKLDVYEQEHIDGQGSDNCEFCKEENNG